MSAFGGDSEMTSSPVRIEVRGLAAGYDGRRVLGDVDFSALQGERVALLGPNGGGKTTLIRTLSGELEPLDGSVQLTDRIGSVPQGDVGRSDWPVTALDLAICGTLDALPWWRVPGRSERQSAIEALEAVGLADRAGTQYGELSGGQRRRARVAAALSGGAHIPLMACVRGLASCVGRTSICR